jgi:hypothetical protein
MFMKGDMSKINSSISPNYERFPPQKPGLEPCLDNFMQAFMQGFGSSFSDRQGETTHVLVDGDYVFPGASTQWFTLASFMVSPRPVSAFLSMFMTSTELKMVCLSKHGILKSLWLSTIRSKKL